MSLFDVVHISENYLRARFRAKLPMLGTAKPQLRPQISTGRGQRLDLWQMDAAMGARHHGFFSVLALSFSFEIFLFAFVYSDAVTAPHPYADKNYQQNHQILHIPRPKSTSKTKREPTYASNNNPEPMYSTRTAVRPRQPNLARPTNSTAKANQDSVENMILWSH